MSQEQARGSRWVKLITRGAAIRCSKYCSRCSDTNQGPLNGNCAANTAKTKFCDTIITEVCTQCKSGYFLLDGECYEINRHSGSQVCTQTYATEKCQTCANSLNPDGNGVCPACPAGCSKCSSSSTCTDCLAGYFLSSSKCVKCDTDDSNIKGVPNCVSRKEPSGSN